MESGVDCILDVGSREPSVDGLFGLVGRADVLLKRDLRCEEMTNVDEHFLVEFGPCLTADAKVVSGDG